MYKCIQTHDFASFQHTDGFLQTFPSCSRRRTSMRKGGFRPRLGVIVHYPSPIVKRGGCPLTAEEVF